MSDSRGRLDAARLALMTVAGALMLASLASPGSPYLRLCTAIHIAASHALWIPIYSNSRAPAATE